MPTSYMVLGPPGTGKTTYVAEKATEAARRFNGRVLICSLTKAAAVEAKRRDIPIDDRQVGTMHAHCLRALGRPELAVGKRLVDWNKWVASKSRADLAIDASDGPSEDLDSVRDMAFGSEMLERYTLLRSRMKPRDSSEWGPQVTDFAKYWEQWKAGEGVFDFEDLIETCREDRIPPPGDPHVVYVDEGQDLSASEIELARVWGETAHLVVVGDQDQSIYEWRGACPDGFASFASDPERVKVLSQSYRVPKAVHEQAVRWIGKIGDRLKAEYRPTNEPGEFEKLPGTPIHYTNHLLRLILEDADAGMSVMILASCSYMLSPIVNEMRSQGVPFHNPYNPRHGGWNPLGNASAPGSAVNRVRSFLEPMGESGTWTAAGLYCWIEIAKVDGLLTRGAKARLKEVAETHPLAEVPDEILAELFLPGKAAESLEAALDGKVAWLRNHAVPCKQKTLEFPARIAERRGLEALNEKPKIIVGSIHSVKGGEADSVYLCPDLSAQGWDGWTSDRRNEIVRTFYVAMTRARRKLTILTPRSNRALLDL